MNSSQDHVQYQHSYSPVQTHEQERNRTNSANRQLRQYPVDSWGSSQNQTSMKQQAPPQPHAYPVRNHVHLSGIPISSAMTTIEPTRSLDMSMQEAPHVLQRLEQLPMMGPQHFHRSSSHDPTFRKKTSKKNSKIPKKLLKSTKRGGRHSNSASSGISGKSQVSRDSIRHMRKVSKSLNSHQTPSQMYLCPAHQANMAPAEIHQREISPMRSTGSNLRQPLNFIQGINDAADMNQKSLAQTASAQNTGLVTPQQYMIQTIDSNSFPSTYQKTGMHQIQMAPMPYANHQSSQMSSLERRSSSNGNYSRMMPSTGQHVNHTAFFPKNNTSLNHSGLQFDAHGRSLRPDTKLGINSNDNSKWLSSIEHVVSGEVNDQGYNNQMLDYSVPLYQSTYDPDAEAEEVDLEEQEGYHHQVHPEEHNDARYHIEERYTPNESPEPPSKRISYRQPASNSDRLLNDTGEIERSYEKLTHQYRQQQKFLRESGSTNQLQTDRDRYKRGSQEHTKPGSIRNYRRTSETSESPRPREEQQQENMHLHRREMSFQQIQMQRGVQVTANPVRMQPPIEADNRYASMSPSRNIVAQSSQQQHTVQSSEQLMLSNKTSHRSRSLDITNLDHRSDELSHRKMQMSNQHLNEEPTKIYSQSNAGDKQYRRSIKSQGAQDQHKQSSPRFSQNADSRGNNEYRDAPHASKTIQYNAAGEKFVTPTTSQMSAGEGNGHRRRLSSQRQRHQNQQQELRDDNGQLNMELQAFSEGEQERSTSRSESPTRMSHTQQVQLSNMNFNTQDLIKMTQNTNDRRSAECETIINKKGGQPSQKWTANNTEFYDSSMAYTQELQSKTKIYDNQENQAPAIASNDDTFRGENFINQQSFRDMGMLSNGTGTIQSNSNGHSRKQFQTQGVNIPRNMTNELMVQSQLSTITDYAATKGNILGANEYLNQQVHCLNHKYASLKFSEFTEKLWLKQKLEKIHQNFQLASENVERVNNKSNTRVDAYGGGQSTNTASSQINYSNLTIADLVNKIKHLSKKALKDARVGGPNNNTNSHQVSRGLSKLSEIDSNFQISRISPRGPAFNSTLVPNNIAGAQNFQTVNNHASTSTFKTKYDVEQLQEFEAQLQAQKEQSDAVINNLRKTQKDLINQIKGLELRLQEAGANLAFTPSLANIEAKVGAKSELITNNNVSFLDQKQSSSYSHIMQLELEEKESQLKEIKNESELFAKSLKGQYQNKFNDQAHQIDEIKSEMTRAVQKNKDQHERLLEQNQTISELKHGTKVIEDEKQRLEMELGSNNRQMNMLKSQLQTLQKTKDADERRVQQHRDQEKHWKTGYETIFAKYTKLKDQLADREDTLKKLDDENSQKLNNLTRRAEHAIRYFKDLAIKRSGQQEADVMSLNQEKLGEERQYNLTQFLNEKMPADNTRSRCFELHQVQPRVSRFSRDTREPNTEHKLVESYSGRARSANAIPLEYLNTQKVTPSMSLSQIGGYQEDAQHLRKSFSPNRTSLVGSILISQQPPAPENFMRDDIKTDVYMHNRNTSFSPGQKKKLTFIEKLQNKMQNSKPIEGSSTLDPRVTLAIEAVEQAFEEITSFKQHCTDLCKKYLKTSCIQTENMQVMGFDYYDKLDEFKGREQLLRDELKKQSDQIGQLKEIVGSYKKIIETQNQHMSDAKVLKELQWKNIIDYDQVKNTQKTKMGKTIKEEVSQCKKLLKSLYEQIVSKDQEINQSHQEYDQLEADKNCVENQLNILKNQHDETLQEFDQTLAYKQETENRLYEVECLIKDLLFGTCGEAATTTLQAQHNMLNQTPNGSSVVMNSNNLHQPSTGGKSQQFNNNQYTPKLTINIKDEEEEEQVQSDTNDGHSQSQQSEMMNSGHHVMKTHAPGPSMSTIGMGQSDQQPMMPLEWLDQIRGYIQGLHNTIGEDRNYLSQLQHLVSADHDNQNGLSTYNEIYFEDQNASSNNGGDSHMEPEMTQTNNIMLKRPASRNGATQMAQTYSGFNTLENGRTSISGINYVSSGINTPKVDGSRVIMNGQGKPAQHDTLSQSLESFVKQNARGEFASVNPDESVISDGKASNNHIGNLSDYAMKQTEKARNFQDQSKTNFNHFQTFNENSPNKNPNETSQSSMNTQSKLGMTIQGGADNLQSRLLGLIDSSKIKSKTILYMQQEIEKLKAQAQKDQKKFNEQQTKLERLIADESGEKQQISFVYEQENQMRQELEVQVDQLLSTKRENEDLITNISKQLSTIQSKYEKENIDRQKTEQSADYWQNSFKEIETTYLEEKHKSEDEINRLQDACNKIEAALQDVSTQLSALKQENQALTNFKNIIDQKRQNSQDVGGQTNETAESIAEAFKQNRCLNIENDQVKKDIQVLLESYDGYKQQAQKTQEELQIQIQTMNDDFENQIKKARVDSTEVINHLNSEIQEVMAQKLQHEDRLLQLEQENQELKTQIDEMIDNQECQDNGNQQAMVQMQNDLQNMKNFNDLVQNFNYQLIEQVNNIHQRMATQQLPRSIQGLSSRQQFSATHIQPPMQSLQNMPTLTSGMSIGHYATHDQPAPQGNNGAFMKSQGHLSQFNASSGKNTEFNSRINLAANGGRHDQMKPCDTQTTLPVKIHDGNIAIEENNSGQIVYDHARHQSAFTFYDGNGNSQSSQIQLEEHQSQQLSRNIDLLNRLRMLESTLTPQPNNNNNDDQLIQEMFNENIDVNQQQEMARVSSEPNIEEGYECQQCEQFKQQLALQQEYISKVISNYMSQARRLTGTCLEGSMLLRLDKKSNNQLKSVEATSSSCDLNSNNGRSIGGTIETKIQIIRQANKFLQKDVSKFMNPLYNKQDRLFRYMADIVDITSKLIQNSCDISLKDHGMKLANVKSSTGSLKIGDYRNNKSTQTKRVHKALVACQTDDLQMQVSANNHTREAQLMPMSSAHIASMAVSSEVLNEIDWLGSSLDNKISNFCQILMSLKEQTTSNNKQSAQESTGSKKVIQGLIGTISKTIHELTEDTKMLGDIKAKLEPEQVYFHGERESQTQSVATSKYDYHPRQGGTHQKSSTMRSINHTFNQPNTNPRTDSSLSYDMPLQRGINTQKMMQSNLNFVHEDGDNSESGVSKTYTSRDILPTCQQPVHVISTDEDVQYVESRQSDMVNRRNNLTADFQQQDSSSLEQSQSVKQQRYFRTQASAMPTSDQNDNDQGTISSRSNRDYTTSEPTSRSQQKSYRQVISNQRHVLNETKTVQNMVADMNNQIKDGILKKHQQKQYLEQPNKNKLMFEVRHKSKDQQETHSMSKSSSQNFNSKRVREQIYQEVLSDKSMSPRTYLNHGGTINQSSSFVIGSDHNKLSGERAQANKAIFYKNDIKRVEKKATKNNMMPAQIKKQNETFADRIGNKTMAQITSGRSGSYKFSQNLTSRGTKSKSSGKDRSNQNRNNSKGSYKQPSRFELAKKSRDQAEVIDFMNLNNSAAHNSNIVKKSYKGTITAPTQIISPNVNRHITEEGTTESQEHVQNVKTVGETIRSKSQGEQHPYHSQNAAVNKYLSKTLVSNMHVKHPSGSSSTNRSSFQPRIQGLQQYQAELNEKAAMTKKHHHNFKI